MKPFPYITVTTAVLTGLLLTPAAAVAAGPPDEPFGQHVRTCAQTEGLSGSHNPGMHHGYAGWDGMPCPA